MNKHAETHQYVEDVTRQFRQFRHLKYVT